MHDSYCLYSLCHSAMVEISVMLISTILLCDIILLLFLLLFLYMFNIFLYVYGPCVCNKDILLLLLLFPHFNRNTVLIKGFTIVRCNNVCEKAVNCDWWKPLPLPSTSPPFPLPSLD